MNRNGQICFTASDATYAYVEDYAKQNGISRSKAINKIIADRIMSELQDIDE